MKNPNRIITTALLIAGLALAILSGCKKTPDSALRSASVRLNWIPSCSFAGEMLGIERYSKENGVSIKLEAGGPGIDPIKLVQSGANTFGVAGSDLVLVANDKGADFVIIGLVSYDSPGVWLAKTSTNIRSIADVHGKRIGELPGGNMQYLYEVFLKRTGLKRGESFTPVPIPFDLKNFIAKDDCDLRPVFVYDETSDLKLQGIDYTLIEPKNFGIQFKGICYFCKRSTMEDNPELVQAFINTMARGWEAALDNPEEAIAALKRFDDSINPEKELLGLQSGRPYLSGYEGKVLSTDVDSWKQMATDMVELGFLSKAPDLERTLQFQFVTEYHKDGGD